MQPRKVVRLFVIIAIILVQASFIASAFAAEIKGSNEFTAAGVPTLPPLRGTISGLVTNERTGAAINRAAVTLYRKNGANWKKEITVRTASNGTYIFTNRRPGIFRIEFKATRYKTEYFNNAKTLKRATNIPLAVGSVVNNINAQLTPQR